MRGGGPLKGGAAAAAAATGPVLAPSRWSGGGPAGGRFAGGTAKGAPLLLEHLGEATSILLLWRQKKLLLSDLI